MKTSIQLATDIMGTKIKTTEGEDAGVVQNIMINPEDGIIAYVMLCYANFVGKKHRHYAIPCQMLTVNHSDDASIILKISKEKLIEAQPITPENQSFDTEEYGGSFTIDNQKIYELLPGESPYIKPSELNPAMAN